ncbi:MAG: peptidylprolyl isomerase [Alphaproteobacteria bacterium]
MKHLLLLALLIATATHALEDRVVAIINNNIITEAQVNARTSLRITQLGIATPTPQQTQGLAKRTLSDMIDEELQRQYGESLGMQLPEPLVENTVKDVRANTPVLANITSTQAESLRDQVSAELRWASITAQIVKPQVDISNAETDQIIADMTKSRHVLEREISQIFVSVDESNEAAARTRMEGYAAELAKGADFSTLARTNSEDSASASAGGHMGWFSSGELNPQLEEALNALKPGQTSGLIRTPLGFHIIKLINVRTTKPIDTSPVTELNLFVVSRPQTVSGTDLAPADAEALTAVTQTLQKPFEVEAKFTDTAFTQAFPTSSALGWVSPANLQSAVQQLATNLQPGQWSSPFLMNGNVCVLYLAATRQAISPQLTAYRERVKEHLLKNRLELASRRLMRDLRAKAFVDIRW